LAIEYENAAHRRTKRTVRPYGLVVKTTHWYLIAYCESRREVRTFSVNRIHQARLLAETFPWPKDFSLEAYWKARARDFTTEVARREGPSRS
jgi:predicted DNA-binding transcriptional regulator YafY